MVTGRDATRLVNRIIARDINKVAVGQVIYCCWCDEQGTVIDDGTISRLTENTYRWTAADPSLRWFRQNAIGMDIQIQDISEQVAALALQGPTSGKLLKSVVERADIANLKYFRVTHGSIAGVPLDISRTGYTGDLGYELWMDWKDAVRVWDALVKVGREFDLHPAGMLALDVARIEAGLILIDVDYNSSKRALIASHRYYPDEIGLGRMVHLDKENFIGRNALIEAERVGTKRRLMGLEIDWTEAEKFYDEFGLPPQVSSIASRVAVPVYRGTRQVGRATSTTWSPLLKKMIALASIATEHSTPGTRLQIEFTVEAVRRNIGATVVQLPFFNPKRKTATPV
jgi:aminomethyltransferase